LANDKELIRVRKGLAAAGAGIVCRVRRCAVAASGTAEASSGLWLYAEKLRNFLGG
jgi:hypothetical protein